MPLKEEHIAHDKALVLLSGGMDSFCCLVEAVHAGYEPYALFVNYGQLAEYMERMAFFAQCNYYGIDAECRYVVQWPMMKQLTPTPMTGAGEIPEQRETEGLPVTYVPFRNGQMLSLGAGIMEGLGGGTVMYGALAGSLYPDNSLSFINYFNAAVLRATEQRVRVEAPFIGHSKTAALKYLLTTIEDCAHPLPWHLTWSCYKPIMGGGLEERVASCGKCDSCRARQEAFEDVGLDHFVTQALRPIFDFLDDFEDFDNHVLAED